MDVADARAELEQEVSTDATAQHTWRTLTDDDQQALLAWAVKAWTAHGDRSRLEDMIHALRLGPESFRAWRDFAPGSLIDGGGPIF